MPPHGQCIGPHIVRAIGVLFDYQKSSVATAKPIPRPDRLLSRDNHSRVIARAIIGLGRSLELPILAEGVETEAQHAFLVQEGCDEAQGYLMGRPLPIVDYAKLVGRPAIAQHDNYAVRQSID